MNIKVGDKIVVIRKRWFTMPRRAVVTNIDHSDIGVVEFRFRYRSTRHKAALHWNPLLDTEPERYVAIVSEIHNLRR